MSQIRNAVFGALAISATFGAVQLASGHDLIGRVQSVTTAGGPGATATGVNRAAKADRAAVKPAQALTQTIALRPPSVADTSVVVRVPVASEQTRSRPVVAPAKRGPTRLAVACEPPVSVLTEVAKLLQPGRCVT